MATYSESRANELAILTRDVLKELPEACGDFIQSIAFIFFRRASNRA